MNTKQRTWFLMLLVVVLLLLPGAAVFAESGGQPQAMDVAFSGPIQRMSDTVPGPWLIAGRLVMVTEQTRFRPDVTEMAVGDIVRVIAKPRPNKLEARLIVKEPPHPRLLRGEITAMQDGLWTIGDQDVIVNAETRLTGDHPDIGDGALAEVFPTDAGLWAKHIHVKDAPPEGRPVAFRGTVSAIEGGIWMIETGDTVLQVMTDENTHLVRDPGVGDHVGVRGFAQADGSVLARLIAKLDDLPLDTPFSGFVTEILPTPLAEPNQWAWQVNRPAHGDHAEVTWIVIVTEDTRINVDPATVEVGAWVKGAGMAATDAADNTTVVATVVRVTRPPRIEFMAPVEAAPDPTTPDYPQGVWQVGRMTVIVDAETRIRGNVPTEPTFAAGYGVLQLDGNVRALLFGAR